MRRFSLSANAGYCPRCGRLPAGYHLQSNEGECGHCEIPEVFDTDLASIEERTLEMVDDRPDYAIKYGVNQAVNRGPGTECSVNTYDAQQTCKFFEPNRNKSNCYWRVLNCDLCGSIEAQDDCRKNQGGTDEGKL